MNVPGFTLVEMRQYRVYTEAGHILVTAPHPAHASKIGKAFVRENPAHKHVKRVRLVKKGGEIISTWGWWPTAMYEPIEAA